MPTPQPSFQAFCKAQRKRIHRHLEQRVDRVARARHGDPESPTAHLVVTRRGSTHGAVGPVDQRLWEQDVPEF